MKFKIDTTEKKITLLEEVSYSELAEFMFEYIGETSGEWKVAFEPTTITEQIINPGPYSPVQPWPYVPTSPTIPPVQPIWSTGDPGVFNEIQNDMTYEYPSN